MILGQLLLDPTSLERRPPFFVCLMATGQKLTKGPRMNVIPRKPYLRIEYWRDGKKLEQAEGEALVEAERPLWPELIKDLSREPRLVSKRT